MVQKKILTWMEFTPSTNPSIIRKYMDACEQFLLEHPPVNKEEIKMFANCDIKKNIIDNKKSLAILESDLHYIGESSCYTCKTIVDCKDENIITANPFTRAQFVILCKTCSAKL